MAQKVKAKSVKEALNDPNKSKVFYEYLNLPMVGSFDSNGDYAKGIEDYLPNSQYERKEHRDMVVKDINENWEVLSKNGKFHAILATSSISEAIQYYRLLKEKAPQLKITALFDPNIDNNGKGLNKEDGLKEIITDYNDRFEQSFTIPTFQKMKKDISARLAHKKPYERIDRTPEKQIDLLIVVDQMLTGFDSKWINTLYMDKVLIYENIIQAFSRTNRLFGPEKPFGTIRYYRRPHTMEKNIEAAVKLYSGDKPLGLFVDRLNKNLENLNHTYSEIKNLFEGEKIENFSKLPSGVPERRKFSSLFKKLNEYLEAAKVQGFDWDKQDYDFVTSENETKYSISVLINEKTYKTLALRYKELFGTGTSPNPSNDIPYDIVGYLTTIDTDDIDIDYMNSRFEKYLKLLNQKGASAEMIKQAEEELHKTFATLSKEKQKFAKIFLHDIQSGDVIPVEGKTLQDYVVEYMQKAKDDNVHRLATVLGLNEVQLRALMSSQVEERNLNEYGRYEELKSTVNKKKAKEYFEWLEQHSIIPPKVSNKVDKLLRDFILSGGFEIKTPQ